MREERSDYLIAFLIGTVVGVGATLLLAPEPRKKKKGKRYRIRPPRPRLPKRRRKLRDVLRFDD